MSNTLNSGWMDTTQYCIRRQRWRQHNRPPPRLDSMGANPYLQYTQAELDMRRKAEVLKYSGVSNSKTNNLTKAEKYAQMARFARGDGSYNRLLKLQETCPVNERIYRPTSSSDVPGPERMLYMDETVELYNFTRGNTTKATENPKSDREPYTTVYDENAESASNTYNEENNISNEGSSIPVASVFVRTNENTDEYRHSIPVGFNFEYDTTSTGASEPVDVTVQTVLVYVYYNKALISTNDPDNIAYNRIAGIPIPEVSINFQNRTFTISQPEDPSSFFSGHVYLGTVDITSHLCNQPSAIYDIRIVIQYKTVPTGKIRYKTIANMSLKDYTDAGTVKYLRFVSADVSDTTTTENLGMSTIEPIGQTLHIATEGTDETVIIGSYYVELNGDIWWNSTNTFPQSGFINQLV